MLADELDGAGGHLDQIVVCGSVDAEDLNPEVAKALSSGEINWVTVTSPASARSLVRLYGDALRHARLASIDPRTSTALCDLGYEPAAEAAEHTTAGLIDAIIRVG